MQTSNQLSAETRTPSRLEAVRRYASFSATGTVKLRKTAPEAAASQHSRLAGTRGWLRLGEQRLSAQDWRGAIACARAGLEELGDDYAPPRIVDDTSLGLGAARAQEDSGNLEDAATMMLSDLETRTRLYIKLHASEIEE